jgi:hypothetical protein
MILVPSHTFGSVSLVPSIYYRWMGVDERLLKIPITVKLVYNKSLLKANTRKHKYWFQDSKIVTEHNSVYNLFT